jgi:hypothetical protein
MRRPILSPRANEPLGIRTGVGDNNPPSIALLPNLNDSYRNKRFGAKPSTSIKNLLVGVDLLPLVLDLEQVVSNPYKRRKTANICAYLCA